MNQIALYRHKVQKEYYLVRDGRIVGGGPGTAFYYATKDFMEALTSYQCFADHFLDWAVRFSDDTRRTCLKAKIVDTIEANVNGYTGTLKKELVFDVADFEKVTFEEIPCNE